MPAPAAESLGDASTTATPPPAEVTPTPVSPVASAPAPYSPAPPAVAEVASSRQSSPGTDEHPLVLRIPVGTPLAEAERLLILKTLEVSDGNKQRAARILGISRRGLYTKLAAYGEHIPADEAVDNAAIGSEGVNGNGDHGPNDTPTPTPNA